MYERKHWKRWRGVNEAWKRVKPPLEGEEDEEKKMKRKSFI